MCNFIYCCCCYYSFLLDDISSKKKLYWEKSSNCNPFFFSIFFFSNPSQFWGVCIRCRVDMPCNAILTPWILWRHGIICRNGNSCNNINPFSRFIWPLRCDLIAVINGIVITKLPKLPSLWIKWGETIVQKLYLLCWLFERIGNEFLRR